jgi:lipopolysaccharide transport system ATP-binding protein
MRGRVGALIALGAGFNPILTGRENIYINGSVLGLSKKEIDGKIDEIIDFAEIGEFIDSPVQNYSSGMQVRLGFSIASSLSSDVLILDEVLAVGDIGFVIKCLNRVRELSSNAAVILVSHSMQLVSSFCTRLIYMQEGRVRLDMPDLGDAISKYVSMVNSSEQVSGSGAATLEGLSILLPEPVQSDEAPTVLKHGDDLSFHVAFSVLTADESVYIIIAIDDESLTQILTCILIDAAGEKMLFNKGKHEIHVSLGKVELNQGRYSVMFGAIGASSKKTTCRVAGVCPFQVASSQSHWTKLVRYVTPQVLQQSQQK